MMRIAFAALALLALAGCGSSGDTPAGNAAGQLRDAADASTPEAAEVLENGAARLEEQGAANAQQAQQNILQEAGDAQALNRSGNAQAR